MRVVTVLAIVHLPTWGTVASARLLGHGWELATRYAM
jgi:hypothetical protein